MIMRPFPGGSLRVAGWLLVVAAVAVAGGWFATSAQNRISLSRAMPPQAIPTFSNEHIARMAYFYAGGKYVGSPVKR